MYAVLGNLVTNAGLVSRATPHNMHRVCTYIYYIYECMPGITYYVHTSA